MDARDARLIDRDVELLAALREAAFGGPLPPAARIHAWFATHLAPGPWRIVALQAAGTGNEAGNEADDGFPPAPAPRAGRPPAWTWLAIHPGIHHLVWAGPSPLARLRLPRALIAGESQPLATPDDLVHGVQQALVTLRRRELAALARRHGAPDLAHEQEARDQLLARLHAGGAWDEAWSRWSELVLLRHQYQINSIRRRLVELVSLATCGIDRDSHLSWPFRDFIDTIYGIYALTPLMAAARAALGRLAPRLAAAPAIGAGWPAVLAHAVEWLERHHAEPISLRHAAQAAGVSPAHLARLARAHLGTSVLEHLTTLRLARAQELLAGGSLAVAAIAERCGFPSHEHFHRVFRRRVGSTPGAWREANRR